MMAKANIKDYFVLSETKTRHTKNALFLHGMPFLCKFLFKKNQKEEKIEQHLFQLFDNEKETEIFYFSDQKKTLENDFLSQKLKSVMMPLAKLNQSKKFS